MDKALELPREEYESVVSRPVDMERMGTEILLSVFDIGGNHEIKTCYGDIYKVVNALRDYSRMLEMVCDSWGLQGFHRASYEFHAEKLREIAGKFQAGIGYDYDAAVERCEKRRGKKAARRGCGRRGPGYGLSQRPAGGGGQGSESRRATGGQGTRVQYTGRNSRGRTVGR